MTTRKAPADVFLSVYEDNLSAGSDWHCVKIHVCPSDCAMTFSDDHEPGHYGFASLKYTSQSDHQNDHEYGFDLARVEGNLREVGATVQWAKTLQRRLDALSARFGEPKDGPEMLRRLYDASKARAVYYGGKKRLIGSVAYEMKKARDAFKGKVTQ